MVVVLVLLLVLVLENHFLFGMVDGRLEYLVGPLVLPAPVVVFVAVLEVMVADVGVTIGNAYVDALVLEDSGDLSQHFFAVLFGVGSALH